jgi:hypothetical protein
MWNTSTPVNGMRKATLVQQGTGKDVDATSLHMSEIQETEMSYD